MHCVGQQLVIFFREFQLIIFTLDDTFLSSNQDTNQFLV